MDINPPREPVKKTTQTYKNNSVAPNNLNNILLSEIILFNAKITPKAK